MYFARRSLSLLSMAVGVGVSTPQSMAVADAVSTPHAQRNRASSSATLFAPVVFMSLPLWLLRLARRVSERRTVYVGSPRSPEQSWTRTQEELARHIVAVQLVVALPCGLR